MLKTLILLCVLSTITCLAYSQTPIDVAENTFKVPAGGESIFYYGFAKGDTVIFNMDEVKGKDLTRVAIMVSPSSSLFLDYNTNKIENKQLIIPETGIYQFRFVNSNVFTGRICRIKLQRIPSSVSTKDFNTNVYTRMVYDTTYTDATENFLIKTDTLINEVLNQTAEVHSRLNENGNKTITNFILPPNTIVWSYYIGVDTAGQQAYETATQQLISNATPLVSKIIGSNPLAALALGFSSYLTRIGAGESIKYFLVPGQNVNLFLNGQGFSCYKTGTVINDFAKMDPIKGNLSFCFENGNSITPVSVILKVTAIQASPTWGTKQVKRMNITSKEDMYLKN